MYFEHYLQLYSYSVDINNICFTIKHSQPNILVKTLCIRNVKLNYLKYKILYIQENIAEGITLEIFQM